MLIFPKGYYSSKFPPDNLVVQTGTNGVQFLPFTTFIENLDVGGGDGENPTVDIEQPDHGFTIGDVLRLDSSTYVKAIADSSENAEVVGIVIDIIDANNFTLHTHGYIESGLSGLNPGTVYFLSNTISGELTEFEPLIPFHVSKPLLIADSSESGYFFNFRGLLNGGLIYHAGNECILNGSDFITVTFSAPLPIDTNYVINICVTNTEDNPPSIYNYIISEKSETGFTVLFSGNIDSDNYILEWSITGI